MVLSRASRSQAGVVSIFPSRDHVGMPTFHIDVSDDYTETFEASDEGHAADHAKMVAMREAGSGGGPPFVDLFHGDGNISGYRTFICGFTRRGGIYVHAPKARA